MEWESWEEEEEDGERQDRNWADQQRDEPPDEQAALLGEGHLAVEKVTLTNRQVSFFKRRGGLMKKARELAILCDADLALIVFSSICRLYDSASSKVH